MGSINSRMGVSSLTGYENPWTHLVVLRRWQNLKVIQKKKSDVPQGFRWPLQGTTLKKSLKKWLTSHPGSLFHTLFNDSDMSDSSPHRYPRHNLSDNHYTPCVFVKKQTPENHSNWRLYTRSRYFTTFIFVKKQTPKMSEIDIYTHDDDISLLLSCHLPTKSFDDRRGSYRIEVSHSPLTLANFSSIKLVFVFRCSSSRTNPVSERSVDSSFLVFSLSSHRYSYMNIKINT